MNTNYITLIGHKLKFKTRYIMHMLVLLSRHPNNELRPKFVDVVTILNRPEYLLLTWSDEDRKLYSEKELQIGQTLESGDNLYLDLQRQYFNNNMTTPSQDSTQ